MTKITDRAKIASGKPYEKSKQKITYCHIVGLMVLFEHSGAFCQVFKVVSPAIVQYDLGADIWRFASPSRFILFIRLCDLCVRGPFRGIDDYSRK